ncbi:L,D-transpeptidase family protein [Candidatus Uhrbacteria bacterium]|nr:MAG: L,D-transpeptidase family protein [Candidatus Uhrbacteria bacterium]
MQTLYIRQTGPNPHDGEAELNGKRYRCAIGRTGVLADKKEGDGGTPHGTFPLREVFFREDRLEKPVTGLPIRATASNDGWADDSALPEYNTHVSLPYPGSHENLWREDHVYDVILVVGYNDAPPVPGKGSAIFIHLAREGYTPTAGCPVFSKPDLLEILAQLRAGDQVEIN